MDIVSGNWPIPGMNANIVTADITRSRGSQPGPGDCAKPDSWEDMVRQLVSGLRFGVVQITVHESQVVQVERTEKVRFAQGPKLNR